MTTKIKTVVELHLTENEVNRIKEVAESVDSFVVNACVNFLTKGVGHQEVKKNFKEGVGHLFSRRESCRSRTVLRRSQEGGSR